MVRRVCTLTGAVALAVALIGGCTTLRQGKADAPPKRPSAEGPPPPLAEGVSPYPEVPAGYKVLAARPSGLAQAQHAPEPEPERPAVRINPAPVRPAEPAPKGSEEPSDDPVPTITIKIDSP